MPLPRSTSFPIRCCVWEEWETILLNLGRTRFSGIQKNNYFNELDRIDGKPIEFECPQRDSENDARITV